MKQSNASAELLRRSKRLLRIDMTHPILTGTTRPPRDRRITAKRRRAGVGAAVADARRAGTRSMSGSGRCARRKKRALGFGEVERDGRFGGQAAENIRQWQ